MGKTGLQFFYKSWFVLKSIYKDECNRRSSPSVKSSVSWWNWQQHLCYYRHRVWRSVLWFDPKSRELNVTSIWLASLRCPLVGECFLAGFLRSPCKERWINWLPAAVFWAQTLTPPPLWPWSMVSTLFAQRPSHSLAKPHKWLLCAHHSDRSRYQTEHVWWRVRKKRRWEGVQRRKRRTPPAGSH